MNDEYFMREAIKEAEKCLKRGDMPIGCVIVLDGEIISRDGSRKYSGGKHFDHAEELALEKIDHLIKINKHKLTIYSTYEPCPMCFGKIIVGHIARIVYGTSVDQSGATHLNKKVPKHYKQPNIKGGVLAKECRDIFLKSEIVRKKLSEHGVDIS